MQIEEIIHMSACQFNDKFADLWKNLHNILLNIEIIRVLFISIIKWEKRRNVWTDIRLE